MKKKGYKRDEKRLYFVGQMPDIIRGHLKENGTVIEVHHVNNNKDDDRLTVPLQRGHHMELHELEKALKQEVWMKTYGINSFDPYVQKLNELYDEHQEGVSIWRCQMMFTEFLKKMKFYN